MYFGFSSSIVKQENISNKGDIVQDSGMVRCRLRTSVDMVATWFEVVAIDQRAFQKGFQAQCLVLGDLAIAFASILVKVVLIYFYLIHMPRLSAIRGNQSSGCRARQHQCGVVLHICSRQMNGNVAPAVTVEGAARI
jgi:hypothetical protein